MTSETISQLSPLIIEPTAFTEEAEGGLDIGQLLLTLKRKWLLILGVTLATTAVAAGKS